MTRADRSFRRLILVADLPRTGLDVAVTASPEECATIAREFDLLAIESLSGTYHITPTQNGARVRGEVVARLRQTCVASLDPFDAHLRELVDIAFAAPPDRRGALSGSGGTISISPEDEDPPELLLDGTIDLGAVTLEFMALGLDPYPRKPGAEHSPADREGGPSPSPFAALAGHVRKVTAKE